MTKKHFISLANYIRAEREDAKECGVKSYFPPTAVDSLADWFEQECLQFNRERWLAYIAGKCGPNGGEVKK